MILFFDKPLHNTIRPSTLEQFHGHYNFIKSLNISNPENLIIWGPPGVGKSTLAYIIASHSKIPFYQLSAVLTGKKEVKDLLDSIDAKGEKSLIFIDEIHSFNKSQQHIFLKHIEDGSIIFIGATTENPSFEIIQPLLSRVRLIKLEKLTNDDLKNILLNAITFLKERLGTLSYYSSFIEDLINYADGDARVMLNTLERILASLPESNIIEIKEEYFAKILGERYLKYDKNYEEHYNLLSAFHKSLRGSDVDASIYWCMRMLNSGEEPRNIFRRLIACASEDVGNADPNALTIAVNAWQSFEFLGLPEGELPLIQSVIYIASAPKSNSVYLSRNKVKKLLKDCKNYPVPIHLRNPVTKEMKSLNYGKTYKYPHNYQYSFVNQEYLPEELKGTRFYSPKNIGFEKEIEKRLLWWEKQKNKG